MWFQRMTLDVWFDDHQYDIRYDVGESAVKFLTVDEVGAGLGLDSGLELGSLPLRYGHHTGHPLLREEIATFYPGLSADQVVVTSGASEAIFALNAALLQPGDHVIVEHPNYPSLYEIPRSLGCDVSFLPLRYDRGFKPDVGELAAKITPRTKLISLSHPNNPAGSVISSDELQAFLRVAEEHDVHLMFDETYRDLDFRDPPPTAASLSDKAISVSTMSKCYGLPGIRIGWLATRDQAILDAVLTVREQVTIANNALGESIALHVLERRDEFLCRSRERVAKNLETVDAWLEGQTAFEWVRPVAGVVGFPRIRDGIDVDPEALYRSLAVDHATFVIPGRCFEMDNRHFRLGFGSTPKEIEKGLENIEHALAAQL